MIVVSVHHTVTEHSFLFSLIHIYSLTLVWRLPPAAYRGCHTEEPFTSQAHHLVTCSRGSAHAGRQSQYCFVAQQLCSIFMWTMGEQGESCGCDVQKDFIIKLCFYGHCVTPVKTRISLTDFHFASTTVQTDPYPDFGSTHRSKSFLPQEQTVRHSWQ